MFTPLCMKWGIQEGDIREHGPDDPLFLAEGIHAEWRILPMKPFCCLWAREWALCSTCIFPDRRQFHTLCTGEIEETFISLLSRMASELGTPGENGEQPDGRGFQTLEQALGQALEQGERRAYEGMENSLLADTRYYLAYMGLRKNSLPSFAGCGTAFQEWSPHPDQALVVADLLQSVSGSFHERNNALGLLDELEQVKLQMKAQPLPVRRQEFESRAHCTLGLLELGTVPGAEKEFALGLSRDEIRPEFWGRDDDGLSPPPWPARMPVPITIHEKRQKQPV